MKNTYTIPADRREDVEKLVARVQKKAAKYGKELSVSYGPSYAKGIPVRIHDGHTVEWSHDVMVEVFDLTVDSEIVRKDGYTVVASIEHLEGGNVVKAFGINAEVKPEWIHSDCRCEHCRTNRVRSKTFIVRGEDGSELQVGRTCLMDYCGINPQAIGFRNELDEILLGCDLDRYDFDSHPVARVYDTVKALAVAAKAYRKAGYIKSGNPGCNKDRVYEILRDVERGKVAEPDSGEIAEARKMADAINAICDTDAIRFLLSDVRSLVRTHYCKASHLGFIAYAPVAFEKYEAELKRRAEREGEHAAQVNGSAYVGEIGKRMVFEIADMKLVTSWDTQYGTTHLYKFTTVDGNVLVWFASSIFGSWETRGGRQEWVPVSECRKLKGTVKAHNERDGVKQTIITRCAVA